MKIICHNFYRKIIFNASALTYKDRKRTVRKQIKEREKQTRTKNKTKEKVKEVFFLCTRKQYRDT